ncbi:MAG: RNA 2',3'-cyclic phosphodiesterase [Desulfobulbus propionicus]|nr:MAG: RNA 2',3'-cyclic phosphodiesterase [Desulfobulbus propionicus]
MKKRLFVALDLPEQVAARVEPLCSGLPGARWVDAMQLHLTLCFIGEVEGSVFLDIVETLDEIELEPFFLQLDGLGFFPPRQKPRVLWIGVAPNEQLQRLQQKMYNRLTGIGLELEKRKFSPHITIARLRDTSSSKLAAYLEGNAMFCAEPFMVRQFTLYSSILRHQGAVHIVEQEYRLLAG